MESSMKPLTSDIGLYFKSFKLFLERSTEHQCMEKFIDENLPDVVTSIGKKGAPCLNVLGVGSGSDLVAEKSQGLNISFTWNQMRSEEYEKQNKERKESRKFDFIHMIQMLYYVESVPDTIKYFHSLLETNGKLLIIQSSDDGGWQALWEKAGSRFPTKIDFPGVRKVLDEMRVKYQKYELPSDMDITECFIEGNENGERLLDFLTEVADFMKTAPPDLKAEMLRYLRHPECSREENGKIMFNNDLHFIMVDK
ncbi:histamine N-methyltransferase-like isoform X4 [Scyliorhinus canicula]|uniref:histamine N-methyltransferase-like isoform X4 n=1 Tax=Scyliorhinus canicula TaxID=7830 RepID=UPI0018F4F9F7|nr:histamine N-methyltransferase-like isoform X4 [Scyliorhinus canicula]